MLTNIIAAYYPENVSAKSDTGIGVPKDNYGAKTASFNAVFLCLQHCFAFMVGRVGVSSDTLGTVTSVRQSCTSCHPMIGVFGGENIFLPVTETTMSNTAQVAPATPSNPSAVFLKDGKAITTSEHVAKIFRKEHYNVLRDIENLDCSANFRALNFEVTVEIKHLGNINRKTKIVEMTRDGFVFLCMGYTGAKAATFKEMYIKRFNEMEKRLQAQKQPEQHEQHNFDGRWVVNIENGIPKKMSPVNPQAHIATPEEFADRILKGEVNSQAIPQILNACISLLTNDKVKIVQPQPTVQIQDIPKDRVELAKAYLNVVGHCGDASKFAKQFGIHRDTAKRIISGLYRIANHEVYGDDL